MPKNERDIKHSHNKKILLIAIACISLLALIYLFVLKPLYDEYHDRPLVDGLTYVGRDYHDACVFAFGCFGPTTETFYYATNLSPEQLIDSLHRWKLEETVTGLHYSTKDSFESTGYNIVSSNGDHAAFEVIIDKNGIISSSKLLPSGKKYIVSVSREDYDLLRQPR